MVRELQGVAVVDDGSRAGGLNLGEYIRERRTEVRHVDLERLTRVVVRVEISAQSRQAGGDLGGLTLLVRHRNQSVNQVRRTVRIASGEPGDDRTSDPLPPGLVEVIDDPVRSDVLDVVGVFGRDAERVFHRRQRTGRSHPQRVPHQRDRGSQRRGRDGEHLPDQVLVVVLAVVKLVAADGESAIRRSLVRGCHTTP